MMTGVAIGAAITTILTIQHAARSGPVKMIEVDGEHLYVGPEHGDLAAAQEVIAENPPPQQILVSLWRNGADGEFPDTLTGALDLLHQIKESADGYVDRVTIDINASGGYDESATVEISIGYFRDETPAESRRRINVERATLGLRRQNRELADRALYEALKAKYEPEA